MSRRIQAVGRDSKRGVHRAPRLADPEASRSTQDAPNGEPGQEDYGLGHMSKALNQSDELDSHNTAASSHSIWSNQHHDMYSSVDPMEHVPLETNVNLLPPALPPEEPHSIAGEEPFRLDPSQGAGQVVSRDAAEMAHRGITGPVSPTASIQAMADITSEAGPAFDGDISRSPSQSSSCQATFGSEVGIGDEVDNNDSQAVGFRQGIAARNREYGERTTLHHDLYTQNGHAMLDVLAGNQARRTVLTHVTPTANDSFVDEATAKTLGWEILDNPPSWSKKARYPDGRGRVFLKRFTTFIAFAKSGARVKISALVLKDMQPRGFQAGRKALKKLGWLQVIETSRFGHNMEPAVEALSDGNMEGGSLCRLSHSFFDAGNASYLDLGNDAHLQGTDDRKQTAHASSICPEVSPLLPETGQPTQTVGGGAHDSTDDMRPCSTLDDDDGFVDLPGWSADANENVQVLDDGPEFGADDSL